MLRVGYTIHATDKQASANAKHTRATAHVCARALQLAPPPPCLPPCTATRSPRAAARPIWPRTLAPSVPEGSIRVPGPICTKNSRNCMGPSTQQHHCSTPTRRTVCACALYDKSVLGLNIFLGGGPTAPPLPTAKLSTAFCMDASNFAPLRTLAAHQSQ